MEKTQPSGTGIHDNLVQSFCFLYYIISNEMKI
jgi:hypothetical protein